MAGQSQAQKEVSPSLRIPFVRRCSLSRAGGEQPGLILDLSLSGAYVETETMPASGESLALSFRVPGNERQLRLAAVVAWVNPRQPHPVHSLPPGCGLRFLRLEAEERELVVAAIEAYCQSNPLYRQYL